MKALFLSIGPLKKDFAREGFGEYLKRISRYIPVEVVDLKEGKSGGKIPKADTVRGEGESIVKRLKGDDYIVALEVGGTSFDSHGLASHIEGVLSGAAGGKSRIVFIVGGALGLAQEVSDRSHLRLSLSPMTLPHDLARLLLGEQVYRAFTIIRGEPYSH